MKSFFTKDMFGNPIVIAAMGVVIVVALGSILYYVEGTRVPQVTMSTTASTTAEAVTGSGTIEPAENPNLAFESGGRVVSVRAAVGDHVSQGELLASLDVAALAAQRNQASANVEAAQAQLSQMQAGARQVDIEPKQTAVSQANQTLANVYAGIPAQIASAYDKSFSGVSSDSDNLFSNPNTPSPSLVFSTINSQLGVTATNNRAQANNELSVWNTQQSALTANTSPADLDIAINASINHLQVLRGYADSVLQALSSAAPSSNFSSASVTAAQTSVGSLRDTINTLIVTLQGLQQQISSDKLSVQSAQDALNQTLAGSTPEAIEAQQAAVNAAQASVAGINAQISNAEIIAPFAGTVSSVSVKTGDIVAANTTAVSLNPESALQVTAYFSEIDVTKIHTGLTAQVTTDAYGSSRVFPATVIAVDTSPSPEVNGASPGYKVTLQFATADASLSSGMTANVTIPLNQ